jgi:NitT/TauT family transport system ATP-binding protein
MTAVSKDANGDVVWQNTEAVDLLELKHVSQTYDGGKSFVIKDFNLLIEEKPNQGQFVVILGESGCGKSTVLNYIAGLNKPTGGDVLIKGKPKHETPPISMVFQRYSSLPWRTVLENIMLPLEIRGVAKKEAKEKAKEMIAKVGLFDHVNKYAQAPTLSGGQLQRVAIARCLVANPSVILMDEPFGALDINTRMQMQLLVSQLWEQLKPTIIFVTHDVAEAVFLADDIYFMAANPGRIIEHWTVDLPACGRDRNTKKDPRFINMVQNIEDYIFGVIAGRKQQVWSGKM